MTARFLAVYENPTDADEFHRHYRQVHVPLACRLPGLRRYALSLDIAPVRDAPYFLVAELEWDTMPELKAAFSSPQGHAAAADAARLAELAAVRSMVFTVKELDLPAENVR